MTESEVVASRVKRLAVLADQGNPFARYVLSEVDLRLRVATALAGDVAAVLELPVADGEATKITS